MAAEDVKFSITGDDRSYQQTLDKAVTSTERASQRMSTSFARVESAQKKAFSGGAGGSALGAAALQAQDVAVSLEMGASAARVLGQQGSQILSVFGPGGAIAGGALAIGAAIYTWATNAEAANKAFEESAKRLKDAQSAAKSLLEGAESADQRRSLIGTTGAQRKALEERFRHEKAIAAIQEQALRTGDKAAQRIATEAENALHAAEKTQIANEASNESLERRVAKQRELEQEQARGREADKQRGELALSDAQKLKRVEQEIGAIKNRSAVSSTAAMDDRIRDARSVANLAEKELEAAKIRARIEKEAGILQRKAQEDAQDRLQAFADAQSQMWAKIAKAVEAAGKAARKMKEDSAEKSLAKFNERVSNRRKTPQERAEERREERANARAQREVIRRDLAGQTLRDPITGRMQKFEQMGGASRDKLIRDRMKTIGDANEQGVTDLSDASLQKLAEALVAAAAKLTPK